jgi:3-oxoacyl-[acyl-carrier-protein] synthase II
MPRIAVTGMGAITSHGDNYHSIFDALLQGQSGIRRVDIGEHKLDCSIGGQISCDFDAERYIPKVDQRKMDPYTIYGLYAAHQAWFDAGLDHATLDPESCAIVVGSGIGGLQELYANAMRTVEHGMHRVSPFFIPKALSNMLAGHIACAFKLYGPSNAVVSACATGSHAIGGAMRMIQQGDADVVICGGAEAAIHPIGLSGFLACGALSTHYNDTPQEASRPFDKGRDGFVMSDGAAILILESEEHAKKRGARIHGYLLGYGASSDAHHMTLPHPEGRGAQLAMRKALADAEVDYHDIGYINAHATSTPKGDDAEIAAIKSIFNGYSNQVKISSTKSTTGHLLGAAGSLEAIISLMALQRQIAPPTINLEDPEDAAMNFVPWHAQEMACDYALSNSFGFGGANAALVFGRQ